ncbi:MAG: restriction endonuclease [Nitrospiraceae bacterium]|nr:MAG: restriction endonuclease [Nitrospiraceae bacterium]
MKIRKASGKIQEFDPRKLLDSLMRSGAARDQAENILEKVMPDVLPLTTTKQIYRLAHKYLKQLNHATVLRYSLKKGILRLGPSGYPFEKYFGELLKNYGYDVQTNLLLEGKCVSHEVDVFAVNDREIVLVECKYRNRVNSAPDVKVAMYVHARFQDLRTALAPVHPGKTIEGWLVTNTRFTTDAIQFADCAGFQLKSWRHPDKLSLEKMIEENKLYPITVLSSLNTSQIKRLLENKVILMKDLARMEADTIKNILSISDRKALNIRKEAEDLCFC